MIFKSIKPIIMFTNALLRRGLTYPNNWFSTLGTSWCKVLFIVLFTVQEASLFYETNIQQFLTTPRVLTDKVVRAPGLTQGYHKRPSET